MKNLSSNGQTAIFDRFITHSDISKQMVNHMEESNLKVASNTSTRFDSFLMGGLLTEVNWIQLHHKRNIWKCLLHSVIFFPVTISVVFTPFSAEFELSHGMIHSKYFSRSDAKNQMKLHSPDLRTYWRTFGRNSIVSIV